LWAGKGGVFEYPLHTRVIPKLAIDAWYTGKMENAWCMVATVRHRAVA